MSPSDSASTCLDNTPILQPGRNCWRIERAHRFGMLIDADAYFRAVRHAIRHARRSVFILGWDIDSRMLLVPDGANDGYPEPLGEFLHAVVAERPNLRIYVLNWDFAMLYALEREWLPVYKLGWRTHRRLAFHMDGRHPAGASHHQKVVVIDDALAFVGGLDLTGSRWDTPEHAAPEPRRRDCNGKPYAPFHDVQAMVDGDVARALGELCRERWRRATGTVVHGVAVSPDETLWPNNVVPDLTEVPVAIARTEPAYDGHGGVFEVRQLHLDAIARAHAHLFFENQYFTSDMLGAALAARLQEARGPEMLVITPQTQSGWLEESTMGILRARLHRRLQAADRHARYRLCCPRLPGLHSACLNVHSKVFTADDRLLSVGSANLSNRSMAFDTECNLAIEAVGDESERARVAGAIAGMRARLLAEHLAATPQQVAAQTRARASLHAAVDAVSHGERTLVPLHPSEPETSVLIPEPGIFDSEKPIEPDRLVALLVPEEARRPAPRRLVGWGMLTIGLALLAVAWRWTPLGEWVNLASLVRFARTLDDLPATPLVVVTLYMLAGQVVPITLLIAATGVVFGPLWGALYALVGSLLAASVSYGLGEWLGREKVRRLFGPRINKLSKRIAKRGVLAMMIIRVLPIAPFAVVNVVAGASHLRYRDFALGTAFGMAPGILLTVTFVHNLAELVRRPSADTLAVLIGVALLLIASAFGLRRLVAGRAGMGAS